MFHQRVQCLCDCLYVGERKKEEEKTMDGEHLLLVQPYSIHRPEEKLKSRQGPVERVATKPHPTCGATHTHSPAGPQINREKKERRERFSETLTETHTNTHKHAPPRHSDRRCGLLLLLLVFFFLFGRLFSSSFGWKSKHTSR